MPKGCPDCKMPMFERTIRGLAVDICLQCGGMWLDRGEIARLRDMRKEEVKEFDDATPETHAPRSTSPGCPICGKVLEPFSYCGGQARLERCVDLHGIWVPEDQLLAIAKPTSAESAVLIADLNAKTAANDMRHRRADAVLNAMTRYYGGWGTGWWW